MEDKNIKGHASLLVAYIIFGINTPVSKAIMDHGEVNAGALTFFRIGGAALLFWTISLFTKKENPPLRDLIMMFVASLFGILLNQAPFIVGLSLTSPINASVIVSVMPVITMILAAFFLKEPITWKKAIGVFVGASGALLLIFSGNMSNHRDGSLAGNLLCLLSTCAFAVYLSAFKKVIVKYSPITFMKWMFLFASTYCLPFYWNDITTVDYASIPDDIYLRILYVIVCATFVSYLLIPIGQKKLRPTIVSMYNYLQPITSSLVAVGLGMDRFGWLKGSATALVFIGVYIVTKSKSYAQMKAENPDKYPDREGD
ncbi:MAG: DMT family transporter [Prevotellaceae bacterium]|jgi:drug/metabolite transporter (DMT)-like permease|nr:DMT family transporter [Prevotellaceae bacterium]